MQSILFTFVIFVLAYVKQTVRTGIKYSPSASERELTLDNDPKKKKRLKQRNTKYLREQRCRNDTSVQTYQHKKTKTKHIFKGKRAQKRFGGGEH